MSDLEKAMHGDKEAFSRLIIQNKESMYKTAIVILKNEEGVFVLTPSLNKSFKFQSDWPYNNSQSYLLQNILNDIENDDERKIAQAESKYNQDIAALEKKDQRIDLELKKLDTEHQALQLEYDSVKNVVDKNVEKSFQTFG